MKVTHMAPHGGRYALILFDAAPPTVDAARLAADLDAAAGRLSLDTHSLNEIGETEDLAEPEPSHLVSVYGADHPGIVHAVSSALAGLGVTITDLETRLAADGT